MKDLNEKCDARTKPDRALVYTDDLWSSLSAEEKHRQLYYRQKRLLDTFLEHHAISEMQYKKSLSDLTQKMNIEHPILR